MPTSLALEGLSASLGIVNALLKLERAYRDPPLPSAAATVEGLRAGAAVLIVASFEEFLKTAFRTELSRLTADGIDFGRLPDTLRVEATFKQLESAMKSGGEKLSRLPDILSAAKRVHEGKISVESLAYTKSNPSAETVTRMFKDIGYNTVLAQVKARFESEWGSPVASTFIRDKLEEIVQRRHDVAHSGRALNVSRLELRESVRYVRVLSRCLDAELRRYCISTARAARTR